MCTLHTGDRIKIRSAASLTKLGYTLSLMYDCPMYTKANEMGVSVDRVDNRGTIVQLFRFLGYCKIQYDDGECDYVSYEIIRKIKENKSEK